MSKNQRQFERSDVKTEVALSYLEDSTRTVVTRDISEGGLFMRLDNPDHYPLGEVVNIKYTDPLTGDTNTEKDAIIVRCTDDGIAVAFVEMEEF
ncbi:hypothetical protein MNBD_GAMMA05-309 [hydrothermal vent metagenome]|uniref:PilZ domain-containing protein n=1 Tax=hydrothermal vent metagenome TaxID=652676 RepID=A0A3B0WRT6_9ZZZZ